MTVALALLAGAVGAVLRDEVVGVVRRRMGRPALRAVALINVVGAFLLGGLIGAGVDGAAMLVLGGGLLGGFTTYSTWMAESALVHGTRRVVNVLGQAVAGVALAGLGVLLGGVGG